MRTVLFATRMDDAVTDGARAWTAAVRRARHVGDVTRWKKRGSYLKAFDRLLRDLKAGL